MESRVLLLAISIGFASCGGSTSTPTNPPSTTSNPPITISGREHIGWTQAADSVANYVFLLYVDDIRNQLPQAACTGSAAAFDCNSPLPPLTNGKHTLQLAAAISNGGLFLEGPKSAPITVTVDASASLAGTIEVGDKRTGIQTGTSPTWQRPPQGGAAAASPVGSCGLTRWDPGTALAWTTSGDLELASLAAQNTVPLVWDNDLESTGWGLASVARRANAGGSWLYVVATVSGDEPAVRVVRYRELNAVLGERAVLLQRSLPAAATQATAAFGPNGLLYVSFRWATAATEAQPFVLDIDVDAQPADGGPTLDPRFLARDAIAAAWGSDDRYWILESATTGSYSIRASDDARPAWNFAADATPIGLEALGIFTAPSFAAFTAQGDDFVLAPDGRITRAAFSKTSGTIRQATLLLGNIAVSCGTSPTFTLSYSVWRPESSGSAADAEVRGR